MAIYTADYTIILQQNLISTSFLVYLFILQWTKGEKYQHTHFSSVYVCYPAAGR